MPYAVILILGTAIVIGTLCYRVRSGKVSDKGFVTEPILKSYAFAAALGGAVYPVAWLTIASALSPGPISNNLPPGYDENVIRGALLVGAPVMLTYASYALWEHINK
jgi:hypothetical protein